MMGQKSRLLPTLLLSLLAWLVALVIFFPIYWMFLTAFKTEIDAFNTPPLFFGFDATLENFLVVQERSDYLKFFFNSVIIAFGSTFIGLLIAVPAVWSMAFHPTRRTRGVLMWMLSTKMLPPVGVLIPIYLLFKSGGLLDTRWGLIIIMTLINLPILIWMLFTYFKEVPPDILEAARMDGAKIREEIFYVLLPLTSPGIFSSALLIIILSWNEAFWTLNLTASDAGPLTAFIASYSSPEGLFWAKLSAASAMAVMPIMVLGWFCQRQLVRGLTFGAVK